ncbi:MAG TPA: hypothetical protein VM261_01660 [Kofleriaceae bacterium]|nr:hypothetical protein [Kofleriaceae bacterium]
MKMRNFNAIQQSLELAPFLESANGDLYIRREADGDRFLVRRFNRALAPSLTLAYARLLAEAQTWIERDSSLASLVRIEQPIEIGEDFLMRRFVGATSLASFLNEDADDDPPEAPDELVPMQSLFRQLGARAVSAQDILLVTVLARSLCEPTYKTIYSFHEERFVVLDLKPTVNELEQFKTLMGAP